MRFELTRWARVDLQGDMLVFDGNQSYDVAYIELVKLGLYGAMGGRVNGAWQQDLSYCVHDASRVRVKGAAELGSIHFYSFAIAFVVDIFSIATKGGRFAVTH